MLESTNGTRTIRNLWNFENLLKYFTVAWTGPGTRNKVSFNHLLIRTTLRNKNMGQSLFKKYSKFQNFDQIFYCSMTRFRNTNLNGFIQCQYIRTILRKKNMGQSLSWGTFKISKFWWNILLSHDQTQEHDFKCLWFVLIRESY